MSVWCRDCFHQLRNDKCLSNHMQSCDGKASSGSYKAVEKFGNLLNIQYASKSLTGQKHDMHDHGIEMTLTKRICLMQNILEHSNTEFCDAGEDCLIDNVTYNNDDDFVDDERNAEIAQNYDLNGFDNNIILIWMMMVITIWKMRK